ncbi:uncharacterized protein B0H64DRAFT_452460 [Chaetomium fimeti]
MSTRTPRNAGNTGNTGTTRNTANVGISRNTGNTANPGNAGNTRNTGSSGNAGNTTSTGNTGTAGAAKTVSPLFSAEIEVYIKLKPSVEAALRKKKRTNPSSLPSYFRDWDFDLWNNADAHPKAVQKRCVTTAVKAIIDSALGDNNGWGCEADFGLKDDWLRLGPDAEARKWWGIKINTPLRSVSEEWQVPTDIVWEELGEKFDFWIDESCSFHVHVAPGPTRQNRYTLDQIVRMAKGTYFWEHALSQLVPQSRKWNEFALPNNTIFAGDEYIGVPDKGWAPLFAKIDRLAAISETKLLDSLKGGETRKGWTANVSTNFCPLYERGTIEFRRQGGVASTLSTTRCILLAVTLHMSALRYNFDKASTRKDYPDGEELIKELAGCVKKLPETCHGTRFVYWLNWCQESYGASPKDYTAAQINIREEAHRKGAIPPNQRPYDRFAEPCPPGAMVLPAYVTPSSTATNTAPQARQGTAAAAQGRGGAASGRGGASGGRGGAAGGRGGAAQGSSTTPGRGGTATGGRGGGAAASGRGGTATGGREGGTASGRGGGASAGGAPARTTAGARTGGGMTTRLPERLAASSSTAPAAGQRRRQQGDGS